MRSTTPHIGAEPSVGPKTVVVGFPRVVVECLLALTERARGGAAAVEGMNFLQVGEAKASEAPRALHANGPPDAGLEGLLGLSKAVGTHETPFARGRTNRTARSIFNGMGCVYPYFLTIYSNSARTVEVITVQTVPGKTPRENCSTVLDFFYSFFDAVIALPSP